MVCGIYAEHRSIYRDIEEINKAMLIVEVLIRLKIRLNLSGQKEKALNPLGFKAFFWSCWADSNRRPHPYQREKLTFSRCFRSIEPYSLHFIHFPPLFGHRFSTASTAGCGCLCGQKAFPPKTLGCRESLFLFTVYLCHLKLATPLSEQFLGNFLRFFASKVPYRNGQLDSCRYYLIIKLYAAITKEEMESVLKYM